MIRERAFVYGIGSSSHIPEYKQYAFMRVSEKWGVGEWEPFDMIINKESGWNHLARNPESSAFGLAQTLIGTEIDYGCIVRSENPDDQIDCAISYIEKRYKTPSKSYIFHLQNNWY